MSDRPLAVVFGGSRGIGAACVQALVRDGFDVALSYVATAPAPAEHTRTYATDVRDAAAVAQVFADAARDFGRAPNAVVANAGINVPAGPLAQFSDENFRQLVEVNIVGAFNLETAVGRALQGRRRCGLMPARRSNAASAPQRGPIGGVAVSPNR